MGHITIYILTRRHEMLRRICILQTQPRKREKCMQSIRLTPGNMSQIIRIRNISSTLKDLDQAGSYTSSVREVGKGATPSTSSASQLTGIVADLTLRFPCCCCCCCGCCCCWLWRVLSLRFRGLLAGDNDAGGARSSSLSSCSCSCSPSSRSSSFAFTPSPSAC